ncbi:ATP-binding protein [Shewanella donghaensis]|uniref:ATP-binding protein n=1 Tax=Shewanella donghaensis TaxID=238836 RepID=UPI001182CD8D|nr:AAA family ATPase [Shewanella donghaensis]
MDIQQTLLLPSQEALVQRLQHIASYSEQLVLVSGAKGSGKTTLVTALASELDNYNSALVICPMHADSAEIRRKILVQLISSPIFDDALPLSDTLMRIQSSLTKPLHIIIDDAHLLPKELWAECLVLTQIQCAGKPVSLTFTVTTQSFAELTELTAATKDLLLSVDIEPLSMVEREGLYRTLLVRSNKSPFIPREIIQAQIEKQSGTPAEVIALLNVALEDKVDQKKRWPKFASTAVVGAIVMLTIAVMWFFYDDQDVDSTVDAPQLPVLYSAPNSDVEWFNFFYAQKLLQSWLLEHGYLVKINKPDSTIPFEQHIMQNSSISKANNVDTVATDNTELAVIKTSTLNLGLQNNGSASNVDTSSSEDIHTDDVDESIAIIEIDKLQQQSIDPIDEPVKQVDAAVVNNITPLMQRSGYTLQLASVKDQKSLQNILSKLEDEPSLVEAKFKDRYIVLFGQFDDAAEAQSKAIALQSELGLSAPWVRKFSDLKGYQLSLN